MTPGPAPTPLRILIADDQADHRALLMAALREPRYQLVVAHDGIELLDFLFGMPPYHFAAVLCDVYMPGLRGTEVLARGSSRSRFILITGSQEAGIDDTAVEFGAAAVLRKPFDAENLVELVDSVVGTGPPTGVQRRWDPRA